MPFLIQPESHIRRPAGIIRQRRSTSVIRNRFEANKDDPNIKMGLKWHRFLEILADAHRSGMSSTYDGLVSRLLLSDCPSEQAKAMVDRFLELGIIIRDAAGMFELDVESELLKQAIDAVNNKNLLPVF